MTLSIRTSIPRLALALAGRSLQDLSEVNEPLLCEQAPAAESDPPHTCATWAGLYLHTNVQVYGPLVLPLAS